MGCNCKADIEQKLVERFRANTPDHAEHHVALQGYGFALVGNTMKLQPFMPYVATAERVLKGTGELRVKRFPKGHMVFNFCPFCGTKLD